MGLVVERISKAFICLGLMPFIWAIALFVVAISVVLPLIALINPGIVNINNENEKKSQKEEEKWYENKGELC
jgi:hypothetical protein